MSKLKGKTLYDIKIYLLRKIQVILYKNIYGSFGKNSVLESPIVVRNKKDIRIGRNVTIRRNARIEVVSKYAGEVYKPQLIIGDNTTVEVNLHITCASKIIIGNDVLIAGYVTIVDNNHGYTDIEKSIIDNKLSDLKPVVIGAESFIGMGVRIMPGVNIGKHSVIGANSVVNKNIPDYSVAVGNPARIVKRYNFSTGKWEKTNYEGEFI